MALEQITKVDLEFRSSDPRQLAELYHKKPVRCQGLTLCQFCRTYSKDRTPTGKATPGRSSLQ